MFPSSSTFAIPSLRRLGSADGSPASVLAPADIRAFVIEALGSAGLDGQRVCVLIPDLTRQCPLPLLIEAVHAALHGRVSALTVMVALGTHPPLGEDRLARLLGYPPGRSAERYPDMAIRNHEWWKPGALTDLGTIPGTELSRLSDGRLTESVTVRVNRAVVDHDVTLIVGPVLPHEVVGFSGGNKYLFPGVSGQEMIDVSHWLGALITSPGIIGVGGTTPVRALIDQAAALVPGRRLALCAVTEADGDGLHSMTFGTPEEAWADAALVAAATHIRYLDVPLRRVLSVVSPRYDDLWTAAKGIYKVEPIVADGGRVVLFAPGVHDISGTHGDAIRAIGYHCRDYFTAQWDRFGSHPWGVLAHSTHVRGLGTYDLVRGEQCRIEVALATGIDRRTTLAVGLAYEDPTSIDFGAWEQDPDSLVVPDAGETLYRLNPSAA